MQKKIKLGLISACNLFTYFLFQIYTIKLLGNGAHADTYIASTTIPQLVISVIGGSIGYVLVPILSTKSTHDIHKDTWTLMLVLGVLFSLVALTLKLLLPFWLPLTVPGFNTEQQKLCAKLASIQLLTLTIHAVVVVQLASQAAQRRFILCESVQLIANCISIILLALMHPLYGVIAPAWIACIRIAVQSIGLCYGLGWPRRPTCISDVVRTPLSRIKPLLLGASYYRTEPMIDRYLLSNAQKGMLTQYYLVEQIFAGASQLLNKILVAPIIPQLSVHFNQRNISDFLHIYYSAIIRVLISSTLTTIGITAATTLLLKTSIFQAYLNTEAWQELVILMILLSGVMIGSACGQIGAGAFYACGDTVTITRISLITYSLLIPCKGLAFHYFGIIGLAIAASTYSLANFIFQLALMRTKLLNTLKEPSTLYKKNHENSTR